MFVPVDPTLRFALVVHPDNIPHNHPIPRIAKASFEARKAYTRCIEAAGNNGALTVRKVDQGEIELWFISSAAGVNYMDLYLQPQ